MRRVEDGSGPSVARIEESVWTALPVLHEPSLGERVLSKHAYFAAAADGTAGLANGNVHIRPDPNPNGLLFLDGVRWDVVALPVDGPDAETGPPFLGPDGTLWVHMDDYRERYLLRLDRNGWERILQGGVPRLVGTQVREARMAVDGTGAFWITLGGDGWGPDELPPLGPSGGPHGVLSFDGTMWSQYLKGLHVNRVDVAEDGAVFATALYGCPADDCNRYDGSADWSLGDLYLITPEAVAAPGFWAS